MAKHLLEIAGGGAKALPALGLVAMALCTSACLVTDTLVVEPPPPVPVNHPVVIVEDSVSPQNWAPVQLTRTSNPPCTQVFEAKQVTDEDLEDNLSARWFLDCATAPTIDDWLACKTDEAALLSPDNSASRIGPFHQLDMKNPRLTPGLHILKLLVSDKFLVARPGVEEGYSLATYEWAVLVASDCQGVTP